MRKNLKKTNKKRKQKKAFLLVLPLIITLFNFNFSFSAVIYNANNKEVEVYKLTNPKTKEEYYINSEKQIIAKANGNKESLYEEKDIYSDETKYIKKEIRKNDYKEEQGIIDRKYEYYDLTGQKQNFNEREILAIVNSNVIYKDGHCYNDTLKVEMKLEEFSDEVVKNKNENKLTDLRASKFSDFIVISFQGFDGENNGDLKEKIYIYDLNLKLKKKINQYIVDKLIKVDDLEEVLVVYQSLSDNYNFLDKNLNLLLDKNIYEFQVLKNGLIAIDESEESYKVYNLKTKKIQEEKKQNDNEDMQEQVVNEEDKKEVIIKSEYDFENLSTNVKVNEKIIVLKDMKPQSIESFYINDKIYLYVRERQHNYIYDINGKLIKVLPDTETKINMKIIGGVCFVNYSESKYRKGLKVFNEKFEFKEDIENQGKEDALISLVFDKYIYIKKSKKNLLYDKEYNSLFGDFSIDIFDNKYIYYYDKNKKSLVFYDKDLVLVKEIKNRYSIEKIADYYLIKEEKKDLYDKDLNPLIENKDDFKCIYSENGDGIKYIIASISDKEEIYNKNFVKVFEVTGENVFLDENTFYLVNDNYFRVIKDGGKESFYEIGKGKVLDDYDYIGDFNKTYFTYAKGKELGLMDYNYNIIYSIPLEKPFLEIDELIDDSEYDVGN